MVLRFLSTLYVCIDIVLHDSLVPVQENLYISVRFRELQTVQPSIQYHTKQYIPAIYKSHLLKEQVLTYKARDVFIVPIRFGSPFLFYYVILTIEDVMCMLLFCI